MLNGQWILKEFGVICSGDQIPRLEYTDEEVHCWSSVLSELKQLYPTHACKEFLQLFDAYDFQEGSIHQLQDVSDVIR